MRNVARLGVLRRADRATATCSAARPPAAAASAIRWNATRPPVLQDVADDYVSVERAAMDYGVVIKVIDAEICDYAIDEAATKAERETIRRQRLGWLATDPEQVAADYRAGKIDKLDVVRRYAVVLDWDNGTLLPVSTGQFREMFHKRSAANWAKVGGTEQLRARSAGA